MNEIVEINKIVPGGQGLAELSNGKKVFVWGVLPGEKVAIRVIKQKRSHAEAVVEEVITPSPHRVTEKEAAYLSTSPWQIFDWRLENQTKQTLLRDIYTQQGIDLGDFDFYHDDVEFGYRNKMEFSFWWDNDDESVHLAFHRRGSKNKFYVTGSELCHPKINEVANNLLAAIKKAKLEARTFKSVIIRCTQNGVATLALMTKEEELTFAPSCEELGVVGWRLYYSTPKSPASVLTKLLYESGTTTIEDSLLDTTLRYDVVGFFQVNVPVFRQTLKDIASFCSENVVDMFCGVGSIGLSLGAKKLTLVESDQSNLPLLKINRDFLAPEAEIVDTPAEFAIAAIDPNATIIVDPPRAGLHPKLVDAFLQIRPKRIVYLSCDPATQARDVALLQNAYSLKFFKGYNFFPKTPHIESLAVLDLTQAEGNLG